MESALATFLITACAMVTASAAVASARYLRELRGEVRANTDRSTGNRQLLTGRDQTGQDLPHLEGVLQRLRHLEGKDA